MQCFVSPKDSLRVGAVKSILEATAATEDDVHIVKKAVLEKMMMFLCENLLATVTVHEFRARGNAEVC